MKTIESYKKAKKTQNFLKFHYKRNAFVLLIVMIILTYFNKLPFIKQIENNLLNYEIAPAMWLALIFIIVWLPQVHNEGKLLFRERAIEWSFFAAAIYISLSFVAGAFLSEFGSNPYDLSPFGVFNNLLFVFPQLICRELIRNYMLASNKDKPKRAFIAIMLIMSITELNLNSLLLTNSLEDGVIAIFEVIIPTICKNMLLNYLVIYGGSTAGIIFSGIITGFEWFFPILPMLQWLTKSVIGVCVPIFAALYLREQYLIFTRKIRVDNGENSAGLWVTMAVCVAFVWFFAGVFPIYPSVVLTGSMEPCIKPGDIVIVSRINSEEEVLRLNDGDILHFAREDITITHRIKEVLVDEDGNVSFKTKGDNNSIEDNQLVEANDVRGIVTFTVPKLGFPVLWLKGDKEEIRREVVF